MVSREIRWHRRKYDPDVAWTAKTYPGGYYNHRIDLSFTIEAGRYGGIFNRNAVLIVRKREEGKKVAKKVLLAREFKSSYEAKCMIDALMYAARVLHKGTDGAEEWLLEQLEKYPGAPMPVMSSRPPRHGPLDGYPN